MVSDFPNPPVMRFNIGVVLSVSGFSSFTTTTSLQQVLQQVLQHRKFLKVNELRPIFTPCCYFLIIIRKVYATGYM